MAALGCDPRWIDEKWGARSAPIGSPTHWKKIIHFTRELYAFEEGFASEPVNIQDAVNDLAGRLRKVDGAIGPKTLAAVHRSDAAGLWRSVSQRMAVHHRGRPEARPEGGIYLERRRWAQPAGRVHGGRGERLEMTPPTSHSRPLCQSRIGGRQRFADAECADQDGWRGGQLVGGPLGWLGCEGQAAAGKMRLMERWRPVLQHDGHEPTLHPDQVLTRRHVTAFSAEATDGVHSACRGNGGVRAQHDSSIESMG